jgi:hypothetical protein
VSDQFDNLAIVSPHQPRTGIKDNLAHVVDVTALPRAQPKENTDTKLGALIHHESLVVGLD